MRILLLEGFSNGCVIVEYAEKLLQMGYSFDLVASPINARYVNQCRHGRLLTNYTQVHLIPRMAEGFETWIDEIALSLKRYTNDTELVLLCRNVEIPVAHAIAKILGASVETVEVF